MTQALCMYCGALKFGAFTPCASCGEPAADFQLSLAFTDHYLTRAELRTLSDAVRTVWSLGLDEETSLLAFLYYVGRKWPKILEFEPDHLPPETATILDSVYRSHLSELPGQTSPSELRPPWEDASWRNPHPDFAEAEASWRQQVPPIVRHGLSTATRIIRLKIGAGEGAVLQRISSRVRMLFHPPNYAAMARAAATLVDEAAEYRRLVGRFRQDVKNGWSGRTKRQSEYLGGTHVRLEEMASLLERVLRHKAGWEVLTPLEYRRVLQELRLSYRMYIKLVEVVLHPERISRDEPPPARSTEEPSDD